MSVNFEWHRGIYPPSLIEATAVVQLLCTMGYSPDEEIHLEFNAEEVAVILVADGHAARISVGKPELALEEMVRRWRQLICECDTGGTFSSEETLYIWENSATKIHSETIQYTLSSLGFFRMALWDGNPLLLN